ncbi:hypothetical protein NEMIN01_0376 [Nematocida minor]|uniref:uncharacterized protein n=1 Tax=Nematocida minor TaxID=1912983 RepID=UPI0022208839|nr:uncharacterized protein NEMIN01_0376 [Nematocida minor]KAI5189210.1 hypothetical protein NEMIN01_0376 [Nematocida minor]
MADFTSICTVLKRCKLNGILTLAVGTPGQLEIRNTRALEVLRGMMKQPENAELLDAMRIEWEFLKVREKYLKTGKVKKSLLNRAVHLASENSSDSSFVDFIRERAQAFVAYGSKKNDKESVRKMNEIVKNLPVKSARRILHTEVEETNESTHDFQGVPLSFRDENIKELFINKNYKSIIGRLKNASDFDSQIVLAVAKIEHFKLGMHKLLEKNDKKSKKTLERYMTQWNSLYAKSVDLFSANFMDEEYLHTFNKEILCNFTPVHNSILFHPVTYDISSVYIHMPQQAEPTPAGISGMLSRMSLFRR